LGFAFLLLATAPAWAGGNPTITGFTPPSGGVGTSVTVTGTNFSATKSNDSVYFGGTQATITSATTTQIVTTVPLGAATGHITVYVSGKSVVSTGTFTVIPSPTVSSFAPSSGGPGTPVTITGANFSATIANNTVTFNGLGATVTSATATQLVATVPSGASTGLIAVTVNGQTGYSGSNFTVPATVTGFTPTTGAIGTSITITGTGFSTTAGNDLVVFGGNGRAYATSATSTQLVMAVPFGAYTGPLCVVVNGGAASCSTDNFNVTLPTISSFAPSSGPVGTSVTITGTGFDPTPANNSIYFNNSGNGVSPSSATTTQLVVTVPYRATTGAFTVSVDGSQAVSSPSNFTVPLPTISSFTPATGQLGSTVTITGTGFSTTLAQDEVTIGGNTAIANTATPTQLNVTVASGTISGAIGISTDHANTVYSSSAFTVAAPTISSFAPSSGQGGSQVTITGAGFDIYPSNNLVTFNGATSRTAITATSTQIVVSVPYNSTTGPICVSVNGSAQGCSSSNFTPLPPAITSFSPTSGVTGVSVTITGTGFGTTPANNSVSFLGSPAVVNSATSTQLVVTVPSGAQTGTIAVSAYNGNYGYSTTEFSKLPLTVSGFTPTAGPTGTPVTISGTGFSSNIANDRVTFNGTAATVTAANATAITANVPPNITTGPVAVSVNGGAFVSSGANFTPQGPTITGFTPTSGGVGTSVTITGTGFSATPASNAVKFNGVATTVTSASTTQLVAAVPYGTSTGPISISVNGGLPVYSSTNFLVPLPTITNFTPATGLAGTSVTITGTGFSPTPANDRVTFNGIPATVVTASATQLVATVPTGATTGLVGVSVNGGTTVNSGTKFTVPVPTITGFTPTSGPVGTTVTITGTNLDPTPGNNLVTFTPYDDEATVTSASTTQLVVTVPWGASTGPISVRVNGGTSVTSSGSFTVPVPTVTGFTPTSGPVATVVTITGTNFDPSLASNNAVIFGPDSSPTFTNATSATATQLVVSVPRAAATGALGVSVDGSDIVYATGTFSIPTATITGFTPTSGPRGTTVTVTGTNFDPTPTNNLLRFNGTTAAVTSASTTQLVTTVPYGATTGPISLSVSGAAIVSSSTNFTVPQATIANFAPTAGQIGTTVTITGTNFDPVPADNAVSINGLSMSVTSASVTQLVVGMPSCATTGPIRVAAGGGSGVLSSSNFTVGLPNIAGFTPTSGASGTSVTIAGTNFSPLMQYNQLTLNGVRVNVNGTTPTQLVATVPTNATTGPFQLSINGCSSTTSSSNFSVGPGISGFAPNSGQAGTSVTIYGTGFSPTAANDSVKFNGIAATVTSAAATSLVATAPSGVTTGPISVTVAGQTATSASVFALLPTITSFTPNLGPTGTTVTITGSNFAPVATNNAVAFNGTPATVASGSTTQLVVVVPAGASTGPISIGIGDQIAMSRSDFTVSGGMTPPTSYQYDADGRLLQIAPPTSSPSQYNYDALGNLTSVTGTPVGSLAIFSVAPGQGATGDSITINGQGFDANAANDQVKFHGTAATILAASPTQLIVAVPSGATTGAVTVTVAATTANSPAPFAVTN